jgi:hypothetical protein
MNTSYKIKIKLVISSILKILLVATLILFLGWFLVQVALWKNRKPTVDPQSDGTILLVAETTDILGPGSAHVNLFAGKQNIGWWDDLAQQLTWRINVAKTGLYHATIEYSLPPGHLTTLQVKISDKTLPFTVPATGGWNIWQEIDLGTIELTSGKAQMLKLVPIHAKQKGILNFVSLRLERDHTTK